MNERRLFEPRKMDSLSSTAAYRTVSDGSASLSLTCEEEIGPSYLDQSPVAAAAKPPTPTHHDAAALLLMLSTTSRAGFGRTVAEPEYTPPSSYHSSFVTATGSCRQLTRSAETA